MCYWPAQSSVLQSLHPQGSQKMDQKSGVDVAWNLASTSSCTTHLIHLLNMQVRAYLINVCGIHGHKHLLCKQSRKTSFSNTDLLFVTYYNYSCSSIMLMLWLSWKLMWLNILITINWRNNRIFTFGWTLISFKLVDLQSAIKAHSSCGNIFISFAELPPARTSFSITTAHPSQLIKQLLQWLTAELFSSNFVI